LSPSSPNPRSSRLYRWLSWLPLAALLAGFAWVDRYEGWGRWAAAPILLVPVFLSACLALFGAVVCRREADSGGLSKLTALSAVLAAIPLIWFMIRALTA
jgi:hypothetical protein